MKKYLASLLLIAPIVISLTSCGLLDEEVFEGDAYNNPIFVENYYQVYPKEIMPIDDENDKNNIVAVRDEIHLNPGEFVTTYQEAARYDKDILNLSYEFDTPNPDYDIKGYGPEKKLNGIDDIFKYGYLSKLFDGRLFCNGRFQLSRVQMDERGFGCLFSKELITKDYMAFNFKMAVNDPEAGQGRPSIPSHSGSNPADVEKYDSDITFKVSFYLRDGNNYTKQTVSMDLEKVPTNRFESNTNESYVFLAFSLAGIDLTRCNGFSLSYELKHNAFLELDQNKDESGNTRLNHAIMLYEVLMPNSSWR